MLITGQFEPFLHLISVASTFGQRWRLRLVRSMSSFVQSLDISRSDSSTVMQRMMSGDVPRNHSFNASTFFPGNLAMLDIKIILFWGKTTGIPGRWGSQGKKTGTWSGWHAAGLGDGVGKCDPNHLHRRCNAVLCTALVPWTSWLCKIGALHLQCRSKIPSEKTC